MFDLTHLEPIGPDVNSGLPSLARLSDDRLMIAYSTWNKSPQTKSDTADPIGKPMSVSAIYSNDHGRTWTPPQTLISSPSELDYDPNITVIGDIVVVTSTTTPLTHTKYMTTSRTVAVRSEDSGRSWSSPFEIDMGHRFTCGKINNGIVLPDGRAMFGFSWDVLLEKQQRLGAEGLMDIRVSVMTSRDLGKTWQPGSDIEIDARKDEDAVYAINGVDEPALVLCDDNSIYMLCRTGLDRLYETRSHDLGRTWSNPAPSPLISFNAPASLSRFVAPDGQRGILVTWCNSSKNRWPLCAAVSFDDARTWSKPRILAQHPGHQSSYPGCIQAADGALIAVWQQDQADTPRKLQVARFNLDWIQDEAK